jgi:hypothetical protein
MPRKPINHGTRAGYKAGCSDPKTCPGGPTGVKCSEANTQYNRDWRALRGSQARNRPTVTVSNPRPSGLRARIVTGSSARSEPQDTEQTYPQPAEPTYDPPESLRQAETDPDPEPVAAEHDVYNEPPFIITPKIKADVEGKLGLFAAIVGMPWEAIDPYCGQVFAQNVDNMIGAYVPLILRSPGAVKFLTSTSGGWLDWIRALQATWPVIQAIYAHHLARTVARDKRPMPDATMPPGPDSYAYSAA